MRIIKEAQKKSQSVQIQPAVFPILTAENVGEHGEEIQLGVQREEVAMEERDTREEIERAHREAEQMSARAQAEASAIVDGAKREAQRLKDQSAKEIESLKAAAEQEAEKAKKEAYSQGYSTGEEAGFKDGYQAGYTKGKNQSIEETRGSLNMISRVIDELKAYRTQILNDARNDIVRMAISVAERVLHKEIMTDPNSVISVVKNAIKKINFKKQFMVHVNPLDLEVVQKQSAEVALLLDNYEILKFTGNPKVEPGGCIIQTESGTVDARVDRQFQEITEQVLGALKEE